MERQKLLIKLAKEIDLLEKNGQFKQANILNKKFMKLAEDEKTNEQILQGIIQALNAPKEEKSTPRKSDESTSSVSSDSSSSSAENDTVNNNQDQRPAKNQSPVAVPWLANFFRGKATREVAEKATEETAKKGVGKGLFDAKQLGRFGLIDAVVNMGVDYAVDIFEDAQGPYQMYKNHMPDIKKIMAKINELTNNDEVRKLTDDLNLFLQQVGKELEIAKKELKVANVSGQRTVYNHKEASVKLAIRGEFESEAPKYLRDLIQGGAIGAGVGALTGGIGAIPGAILGAGGKLLGRGAEDIWYSSISNTGKAYFQGKDLEQKITRLANTFEELNPQLSEAMKILADQILNKLEDLNVANPRKSYMENVIRHLEKKTLKPLGLSK